MKIALTRREFITHLDGINKFIANLAEGLRLLGHDIVILSWSYRGIRGDELSKWFKAVHGLDFNFEIFTLRDIEERDRWVTIFFDWLTKGSEFLKKLDVDVALVNGVAPLRFRPKIAVAHGPLIGVSIEQRFMLRVLYKTYDRVVCISRKTEKEYESVTTCNEIIPLPLKLPSFKPLDLSLRNDLILHIGTRSVKNPHISVKAIEELRKRGYNVELSVIGPYFSHVEELCKKSFVKCLFNVNEEEKNEILCRAKALILPSASETFSYTCLEAMACGTPLVVSHAVPEDVVLDRHNGIRVRSLDPADYAKVLEMLLKDESLWLSIHRVALESTKQYDHIDIARRYLKIVENTVRRL